MSKPTSTEIANALGIGVAEVGQLAKRGMPVNRVKKAREWFAENGFSMTKHGKSGGAIGFAHGVKDNDGVIRCGVRGKKSIS